MISSSAQTLKSRTRVYHLGLTARDVLVVQSMFRVQPDLAESYIFGDSTEGDLVDLVFVNADESTAMGAWERLHMSRPEVVAIMVSDHTRQVSSHVWIQRPLDLRNFSSLLDAITSADIHRVADMGLPVSRDVIKVMVVDDSFPARQFMKLKLEQIAAANKMNILVDFSDSGERAVETLRETAYDVVFLDVEMAGMDGFEACSLIKAVRPVRVAMLTGKSMPADFYKGRSAGCDNYLAKPPNDSDLRTVLMLTSFKKMTAKQ